MNTNSTALHFAMDRIRSKLSLSEAIGRDVKLKRNGREFVGHCPFHNEKTGSFFVNDDKGKYYCFGCGASGDIFSYLMNSRGYTFMQALESLASEAGVKLPEHKAATRYDSELLRSLSEANKYFVEQLKGNKSVLDYCRQRGLTNDIIEKFSIGYCPKNTQKLHQFADRLMFPIFDTNNNVIAFGGRTIQKDVVPKYVNSSDSDVFQKKETLYAYNISSKNVSNKGSPYIIVEGYMDVVMMHKFGFNTTVASMGTSFSSENLAKLWRYCNEPIICFDGDEAGYNAMVRTAFLALEYVMPGKTLKFAVLPQRKDPDSLLNESGQERMQEVLQKSTYLIDFAWDFFVKKYNELQSKTPEHVANWKKEIFEKLGVINNTEIKNLYNIDLKDRIYIFLKKSKKHGAPQSRNVFHATDRKNNMLLVEATLLYIIIKRRSIAQELAEKLSCIAFSDGSLEKLCERILDGDIPDCASDLEEIAGKYCNVENMSDEEIKSFWNEIFDKHVVRRKFRSDVKIAKNECKDRLSEDTWQRLKALKLEHIKSLKR